MIEAGAQARGRRSARNDNIFEGWCNDVFPSRHFQRDIQLPQARDEMLENAVSSLESDENIEGIFLGGSLAEGNTDLYSDIDLRIVVPEALLNSYIEKKHEITRTFGNVLFLIGKACFVK